MPTSDLVLLVTFIVACLAVWVGLVVVAIRQIAARYRSMSDGSIRTLWIVAVIIFPILGTVAWLLWTAISSRSTSPSYR